MSRDYTTLLNQAPQFNYLSEITLFPNFPNKTIDRKNSESPKTPDNDVLITTQGRIINQTDPHYSARHQSSFERSTYSLAARPTLIPHSAQLISSSIPTKRSAAQAQSISQWHVNPLTTRASLFYQREDIHSDGHARGARSSRAR